MLSLAQVPRMNARAQTARATRNTRDAQRPHRQRATRHDSDARPTTRDNRQSPQTGEKIQSQEPESPSSSNRNGPKRHPKQPQGTKICGDGVGVGTPKNRVPVPHLFGCPETRKKYKWHAHEAPRCAEKEPRDRRIELPAHLETTPGGAFESFLAAPVSFHFHGLTGAVIFQVRGPPGHPWARTTHPRTRKMRKFKPTRTPNWEKIAANAKYFTSCLEDNKN